ncbi:hypothetical protein HDV00_010692 [Rhizophlyctis rosea]|nr:hypothetical protein HDV00_010692 [Rhizophlyctis rosea]
MIDKLLEETNAAIEGWKALKEGRSNARRRAEEEAAEAARKEKERERENLHPALIEKKPLPFIDYKETAEPEVDNVTPVISKLMSGEFHIRAEAAGILRRVTGQGEQNRSITVRCGIIPPLIRVLRLYTIGVLEQCLAAIKLYAADPTHTSTLLTAHALPSLRTLVHSTTDSVRRDARASYEQLVLLGGEEVQTMADLLINSSPWEICLRDFRAQDEAAEKEVVGVVRVSVTRRKKKGGK